MFAKIDNEGNILEYPVYIGMLRKQNPNKSLPSEPSETVLSNLGYVKIEAQDKPKADEYHTVNEKNPKKEGDVWKQKWIISKISLKEAINKKNTEIEQERIKRTELMPYTTPDDEEVEVKLQEEAPNKPRQTWLSGTCSWALAEVQEGNPDATDDLIAADDTTHTMSASDWVEFGKKLKTWVKDNLMASKQHMQAVQDLETIEDIQDYDYTKDYWPS